MTIYTSFRLFGHDGFAPFPGIMLLHKSVKEWTPVRREALKVHERVHWRQQLQTGWVGLVALLCFVLTGALPEWTLWLAPVAFMLPYALLYIFAHATLEKQADLAQIRYIVENMNSPR